MTVQRNRTWTLKVRVFGGYCGVAAAATGFGRILMCLSSAVIGESFREMWGTYRRPVDNLDRRSPCRAAFASTIWTF